MNQDIISTHALTFGYQDNSVISEMTINIHKGEFIALLGQNGCGKSTFLKVLLGQLKPSSGKLTVFNDQPKSGDKRIGYMPQMRTYQGVSHLSVHDLLNITLNGLKWGMSLSSKKNDRIIDDMLMLVDAAHLKKRCINQLSGGELKRIHLAQALLDKPDLLLLDEPLANLDPKMQELFVVLLKKIQLELTVTIIMTAHNPNTLLNDVTRILYFANQQAVIGTIDEIINTETLSKLYGTQIEVIRVKDRLLIFGERTHNEPQDIHHYG